MAATKSKTVFVCQECGVESPKWSGKCSDCGGWNTFVEESTQIEAGPRALTKGVALEPQSVLDIIHEKKSRFPTGMTELDHILGGGVVQGSFVLIGGEPGIGKSTILLQLSNNVAEQGKKVLYISGEESAHQVKERASRLGALSSNLYVLSEVNLNTIVASIEQSRPDFVVVDSIQIIYREDINSAPGSVSQVRECANVLMLLAKKSHIPIFLVGHVNKEGSIAGPKVLEHIVDTVLYFEGDRHHSFRILRAVKNRFGSTNEMAIFEMREEGLQEVLNPSQLFLSDENEQVPGSIVVPCLEGTRPLLMEIQALLSDSHGFGHPRRVSTFLDHNRVALLIAIFEKTLGQALGNYDVFINLVGGIKITEPAADLGVILAMASSLQNKPVRKGLVALGEVGLGGEVRAVAHCEKRIQEAQKLGFSIAIVPRKIKESITVKGMTLVGVKRVQEALEEAFDE